MREHASRAFVRVCAFVVVAIAMAVTPWHGRAQTTLFFEGFEGVFPSPFWYVGDANAAGGSVYWNDVYTSFGSVGAYSGNWKGYCAGTFNGVTSTNAQYTNYMDAFMQFTNNFVGVSRANLRFSHAMPSIETGYDYGDVYIDNTLVAHYTNSTSGWTGAGFSLNAYVGGTHTIKFLFHSDSSIFYEGWYLDDIEVTTGTAPLMDSLTSYGLTNYTGYVIDADAFTNNPAYNRDRLLMNTVVTAENFQTNATNYAYQFTYRLRDTNGNLFPLVDSTGLTNGSGNYLSTNNVSLAVAQRSAITNYAPLKPAGRLSHLTAYNIEMDVARPGGSPIFRSTNGPFQFYHFTNAVSADVAYNVITEFPTNGIERSWLINLSPGSNSFTVTNVVATRRYDAFSASGFVLPSSVPVRLDVELRDASSNVQVPLVNSFSNHTVVLAARNAGTTPVSPVVATNVLVTSLIPAGQINSVDNLYRVIVRMTYTNELNQPGIAVSSRTNGPQRMLAYNGTLLFGDITSTFTDFSFAPSPLSPVAGAYIPTWAAFAPNSGTITGEPNNHYGDGGYYLVSLLTNGTAIYTNSSPMVINGATNDVAGNVRFARGGAYLNTNGAFAPSIAFVLPAGFGFQTNVNDAYYSKHLLSDVAFGNVGLNQSLAPKSNLVLSATIFATEESKPIWFIASAMTWDFANSRFVLTPYPSPQLWHVRIGEYSYLNSYRTNLIDTNMVVKLANDNVFAAMTTVNSSAIITAAGDGTARLAADINFGPGSFKTHYPYNTAIAWTNGGRMVINDDAVVSGGNSKLTGVGPVLAPYVSACEGCSGAASTNYIGLQPPQGELYFTRDGGLVTSTNPATTAIYSNVGSPSVSGKLAWGYAPSYGAFAQSVLAPTNLAFLMPGVFLRGNDNPATDDQGPAVILYTGVASTNLNRIERPLTAAYKQGLADYGGVNVRIVGDGFRDANSLVAGQSVNYKLRGNSKYYSRLSGVSGIHSALGGTFPTNLTLLGYSFTFSNYSLAYLDSDNVKSRTEGSIYLPNPSDATFKFKEMTFTCPGGLDKAEIQDGSSSNHLAYWNADIEALGIDFVSNPGQECDPGTGYLTVGVRGWMNYVTDALHGILGFNPNGTLIPKNQGVAGVDSRLQLPGNFKMSGPNNRSYAITPVGNAYYNKYDPSRAPVGFINFAGKMDIPFFEDLKVQVHTTPKKGTNAPVYLMGGWPRVGSGNVNLGWRDASNKDYFTAAYFDADNLAFPPSSLDSSITDVTKYRNHTTTNYHPRAVKLWLDVVDFDYPLVWNDTLRSFKGYSAVNADLIVIKATHELTYMDAKTASIDFGIKYDGLPKISIANLLVDELGEALGVFSAISNAIGSAESKLLEKGMDGLNTLLSDIPEKLIDELFDAAVDPVIDDAYNKLKDVYDSLPMPSKSSFPTAALGEVQKMAANVSNALVQANNVIGGTGKLIQNIDGKITDATAAIDTVNNAFTQAPKIASVVGNLVDTFASQFGESVAQPGLDEAIAKIQPSINQVQTALQSVRGVVNQLHGPLQQGAEWQKEIDDTFMTQKAAIMGAMNKAQGAINQFMSAFNYATDNPFQHYSAAEFKKKLRKQFKEEFIGTKIVADLQSGIKQRVYDYDAKFKQGLDSYFQQFNNVMRDMISQSLSGVDDKINGALGTLSDYMGAGKISGHAVINDDALRYLRVDGHFEWKVPEKMQFNAFLEIKEIDSENTAPGCTYAGGTATEVTIGANDVDLDWVSPGLHADVEATFVIGNDGSPRGLGGKIQTRGDIKFGGFVVKQVGFAVAFGENNNYLAANVRAAFGGSVEIAGGVFFGRTCVMTPIETAVAAVSPDLLNDVNPKELFGQPPFTGAFVYAEGTFPIWSVGCLFEVRVTVGAGAWYFKEGPKYGGLLKAGVGGTIVCVLSASGDITLIGSKKPEGMTFVGMAHVEGCFGPCPLCICVDTSTSVKYVEGNDWDAKDPH